MNKRWRHPTTLVHLWKEYPNTEKKEKKFQIADSTKGMVMGGKHEVARGRFPHIEAVYRPWIE